MLDNDFEQELKDKILAGLIEHMDDRLGEKLAPSKGLGVTVEAPDEAALKDGLDHAKDVLGEGKLPSEGENNEGDPEGGVSGSHDSGSDEDRLLELLAEDDDEDDGEPGRR